MANRIYPKYKKAAISGGSNTNLLGGNVKALLIDTDQYTYDDAHEFLSDVDSGGIVAASPNLSGKTLSNLADFDSDDPILPEVEGDELEAIILFIDTGVAATSRLVMFQDVGIAGVPLMPDGTNVKVVVNNAGWFRL